MRQALLVQVKVANAEAKALLHPLIQGREALGRLHILAVHHVGQIIPFLLKAVLLEQLCVIGRVIGIEQHRRAIKAFHQKAPRQVGIIGGDRAIHRCDPMLLEESRGSVQHSAGIIDVIIAFKQAEIAFMKPGLRVAPQIYPCQHTGNGLVIIIGQEKALDTLGKQLIVLAGQELDQLTPGHRHMVGIPAVDSVRQTDKGPNRTWSRLDYLHMYHLCASLIWSCIQAL